MRAYVSAPKPTPVSYPAQPLPELEATGQVRSMTTRIICRSGWEYSARCSYSDTTARHACTPIEFQWGSGGHARAGAGAHLACPEALRPPTACRPLRRSVRRAAVHAETRSGQRREDVGLRSSDGARATGISFSVPLEARQSRLPLRFDRRSLLRCEHHRRKSVRRAAVHAETRSGQRGKHRRRIVGDGAPATGSLVLWAIVYRAQWRPLSRPPFALRARA